VPVVALRRNNSVPDWWGRYATLPEPPNQIAYRQLATEAQQNAFVRQAAEQWVQANARRIQIDGREYLIIFQDSTPWLLANGPWLLNRRRTMFRDNGRPTTETILNRPLQGLAIPDGCWRPWDLDPRCLESTGDCAVRMLEACHIKWMKPSREERRVKDTRVRVPVFSREEIAAELDSIFGELHKVGEFPFETGWREEGVTSAMLLRYAEKHKLKAFVHHKDKLVERFAPEGANFYTGILNWAVIGHHCLFYTGHI
jgi:hypothetical protein